MISVNQVIFNNLCKGLKYNKAFATNFWAMAPRSGGGGVQCQDSRNTLGNGGLGFQLRLPRVTDWEARDRFDPLRTQFWEF